MENLNGTASATDDTNASHASLSPSSGTGTDNTGYGSGENSGTNGGGGGGVGIMRATPLGYGENPPMPYPRSARRRGWEGEVLLKVAVSAHGRVLAVHIEQSSGYGILDDTALEAVSEWRFRPARVNGSTRPDTVIVPILFRLDTP
jgi:protein TonB